MTNLRSRRLTGASLALVLFLAAAFAVLTAYSRRHIDLQISDLKSGDPARVSEAQDALARCRRAAAIRIIIAAYDDPTQDSSKITGVLARIGPPAAAPLVDELSRDPRPWYQLLWKKVTGRGDPPKPAPILKVSRIMDALAKIGLPAIEPLLADPPEEDSPAWGDAAYVFQDMGSAAVPGLLEGLRSRQPRTRSMAAFSLGNIDDPRAVDPLIAAAEDPKEAFNVRYYATWALGNKSAPRAFDAMLLVLQGKDAKLRRAAAGGLFYQKDARTIDLLLKLVFDPDARVRDRAIRSLHAHADPRTTAVLVTTVLQGFPMTRSSAIEALVHLDDPSAVDQLIKALETGGESAAHNACIALSVLANKKGLTAVNRFMKGIDIDYVARNYRIYIERGDPSTEWLLIIALEHGGDPQMARDFWLCGNQALQYAGSALAMRKMFSDVVTTDKTIPHPVWGSDRKAALPLDSTAARPVAP